MRRALRCTIVVAAAVLFALPARAGVRVTEPLPRGSERQGFSVAVEPHAAFSMPTGEPDAMDGGHDFGLRVTFMQTRHTGMGVDIDHQHWISPEAGRELDRLFGAFGALSGTRVSIDALHLGVHLRVFPWPDATVVPWLQVGGGVAIATSDIDFPVQRIDGQGFTVLLHDSQSRSDQPEFHAGGGFDFPVAKHVRIGPDVTWRWIYFEPAPSFTAFSAGVHARFLGD